MRTTGYFWKLFDSPEKGLRELRRVSYVAAGCIGNRAANFAVAMNTLDKCGGVLHSVPNGWHYITLGRFVFGYRQLRGENRHLFFVRHPLGCSMRTDCPLALSARSYGWTEMLFSPIWGEEREEDEAPTPEDVFHELNRIRS